MDTIYNDKGCFYRALDDEPVFVLLARDPCAAEAIRWWVTLRQALIGRGQKPLEDHEMLGDALATASAAVVWRSDATDPTTWGQTPRWKHEGQMAPSRELVETGFADKLRERLLANANRFYGYAANHFAKDTEEAWRKGEVNWKEYVANIELLGLQPGEKPTGGSVVARKYLAEEETISEKPRDRAGRYVPLREITDNMRAKLRDYSDSRESMDEPTGFLLEAFEQYADQIDTVGKGMPFIAVDLAAKIASGLRQITSQYVPEVNSTTWPHTRKRKMLAYANRINGFASELEAGKIVGESLRTRTIGKSTLLGEPYQGKRSVIPGIPDCDPYAAMAEHMQGASQPMTTTEAIEAIGSATGTEFDGEVMRRPSRDVTEIDQPELPPHRFAMFDKGKGWAYGRGLEINPTHIPAMLDRMEADGYTLVAALGSRADQVGMIFQRGPRYSGFEIAHGFGTREPDRPESDQMRDWRAGKPLGEIAAPVVLDDPNSLPQFIGSYEGHGVWVAPQMPAHVRSCIVSLLQRPCGPDGLGRGLEP